MSEMMASQLVPGAMQRKRSAATLCKTGTATNTVFSAVPVLRSGNKDAAARPGHEAAE
jgi:hypothetical protein